MADEMERQDYPDVDPQGQAILDEEATREVLDAEALSAEGLDQEEPEEPLDQEDLEAFSRAMAKD